MLIGELQSKEGSHDRFAVAVLTESDFASWKKGYLAHPLYTARQVAHVDLRTLLPRPDVYYVVVSNPPSALHASAIRGTLELRWAPATNTLASAAPASGNPVRRNLISLAAVMLLASALALWSIYEGRKAEAVAVETLTTETVATEKRAA
jgi:hypothetical protein